MKWTFWHSISLPLSVGLILLLGFLLPADQLLMIWILIMIIIIVTLLILGQGITGFWKGVLIDEDNHISLSRFQLLCWMVLVLSAFLASAIMNIRIGNCDALSITLPTELWILLGISTTSLVGSPLIKNTKKEKLLAPDAFAKTRTFSLLNTKGIDQNRVGNVGFIVFNKESKDATLADMFRGEEVSNASGLDISKIQMFYFSVIAIVVYAVAIGSMFNGDIKCIEVFPSFSESMVALLGISHAGYLTSKAIPRPVEKS